MDARFEDASDRPLRLQALDAADLEVISALLQDAVGISGDLAWLKGRRRLALFLNRFRWEDAPRAERAGRPVERVRTVMLAEHVTAVRASGLDPRDRERTVSLLRVTFETGDDPEDPSGVLRLIFAGDGEIEADVEYLEVRLEDVTRPYVSPAGRAPAHSTED